MRIVRPGKARLLVGSSLALVFLAWVALLSCYPGSIEDLAELDTVVTIYDDSFNFGQQQTYSMPDSVFHLCEVLPDPPSDCIDLSRTHDQLVLDTVVQNMADLSYTRVSDDTSLAPPDVRLVVTALGSETTGWYVWYPWNPWYPGYGWWYPPVVEPVSYETGSLIITMVRTDEMIENGDQDGIPVIWTGALNGALGGSTVSQANRLTNGINQAYAQSPYLRAAGGAP